MDIGAWLRAFGLERYEPAFRDNDIDAEVLFELTPEDSTALGVTSIGHRRKLLAAIAVLRAEPGATIETSERSAPFAGPERRQLTVMFCDLVGSTALSARLDPEDLRDVIGAYHRSIAATVAPYDGFVAKYMGDGALIYFGYPRAHEDDAERAVRAALALIDAARTVDAGQEQLEVRIGIATGLAVVGDLMGTGAAQEEAVIGDTPNLAARLQALAPPNGCVIADATRRLVGALFEYEDMGSVVLKGLGAPVQVWRALAESRVESRFEALRGGTTLAPLIGRDDELELLQRRWHEACEGQGRVMLLSGEPGIGKSRLVASLPKRLADHGYVRMRYFCSPHHQNSALYPVIGQLRRGRL